jgi:hypothetical protein
VQILRALVVGFRVGERRLAGGVALGRLARVDAHEKLALLHRVAGIGAHLDHAARHLGGDGRLPDGLDHRFGGIGQLDLAQLDRGRGQWRGLGKRQSRQDGGQQQNGVSGCHGPYISIFLYLLSRPEYNRPRMRQ